MKAVVLTGHGDVDKLELRELPDPEPGAGEALVKVLATSVNAVDWKIRRGAFPTPLPEVLGRDVAGEVVKVGAGVTSVRPGERVMGMARHAWAELVVVKADDLAKIPPGLDLEQAAALPLVATTGAELIEEHTRPEEGETVLVTGAVGGVGRAAVYAAKQRGARVLAGVRRSQKKEAAKLDVDGVVAIDDDAEIAKLPELDAIADTVSGETIQKLLPHLKRGGRLGSVLGEPPGAKARGLQVEAFMAHPDGPRLARLAAAAVRHELVIPIGRRLPLAQVAQANRLAEGGAGKVVLTT